MYERMGLVCEAEGNLIKKLKVKLGELLEDLSEARFNGWYCGS